MTGTRRVRLRRRLFILAAAGTTGGLLEFAYKYLDHVASGMWPSPRLPLVEEMTAAYGAVLLMGIGLPVIRRYPVRRDSWARALPVLFAMLLVASALHTTLNWASRSAILAMFGQRYEYGEMPARYLMEFPMDVMVFSIFIAAVNAWDHLKRVRAGELNAAHVQEQLARAELRNLRAQLEPHFLFNALNAISDRMYTDPAAADEMIGHLAELLRASLRSGDASIVTLRTEQSVLEHYTALLQARFGDALVISADIPPATADALVPPLMLQPLVENAVRHGCLGARGRGAIAIRVWRDHDVLSIDVRDDGAGIPPGADPFGSGIGLKAARDRLRLLFGDRQRIDAGNAAGGGFLVHIEVPFRTDGAYVEAP